ncbi:hypothetical protein FOA52_010879 [Chlamydomonas sp. UWO 241]|nr:hypothetical protein FOA52_010879 [Chlamydomonas sp. UWO 241]
MMMRSTLAAAALALLLLASTAAAEQQDCAAAGHPATPCLAACPDDSPLDACPLNSSACPLNSTATCAGTANHTSGPSVPQFDVSADACPYMRNCTGAKLWCMQTLNQTGTTNWDMDFECSRETETATNTYGCATWARNCTGNVTVNPCAQHAVVLGAASTFAVLAGQEVTSASTAAAPTKVYGNLGVSPGTSVTGFPHGLVSYGAILKAGGAAGAIFDLTTAYIDAAGRVLCPVSKIGNIGGQTIYPGLYKSTSGMEVTGSDLTLDARGDKDAVFIFQMAETFLITTGMKVVLSGGAQAKNVFWQVGSSGTLMGNTVLEGTMMAHQSITSGTGATVHGRVLARLAAVTMMTADFSLPAE